MLTICWVGLDARHGADAGEMMMCVTRQSSAQMVEGEDQPAIAGALFF